MCIYILYTLYTHTQIWILSNTHKSLYTDLDIYLYIFVLIFIQNFFLEINFIFQIFPLLTMLKYPSSYSFSVAIEDRVPESRLFNQRSNVYFSFLYMLPNCFLAFFSITVGNRYYGLKMFSSLISSQNISLLI